MTARLLNLEDEGDKSRLKFAIHQNIVKRRFGKHSSSNNNFQVGYIFLKWDKPNERRGKHSKF